MRALRRFVALLCVSALPALAATACDPGTYDPSDPSMTAAGDGAPVTEEEPDFHGVEPDDPVVHAAGSTVGDFAATGCSTSVVRGLSVQIANEIDCMSPGTLTSFAPGGGITFTSSAVLPFLDPGAVAGLRAVASKTGSVQVNSAFRTVAQQYLLYRWWQAGRCGITAAATPGKSNHESARAVDLANWSSVVGTMSAHGWAHDVPGDPVHFDHLSSPDLRGMDVHAFQRLWNRNHPGDRIAEDGAYGPQTGARLAKSPAGGFAIGACK